VTAAAVAPLILKPCFLNEHDQVVSLKGEAGQVSWKAAVAERLAELKWV